jgi:MFS transporter, CP family, cyanate transporter
VPPASAPPAPTGASQGPPGGISAAWIVIAGGTAAALHVGKMPPAIATLQAELGATLVQAGFLLSLVQAAGMLLGLAMGAWADRHGAVRSMVLGLLLLAAASAAGATSPGVGWLLGWRMVEGLGFLLAVLPAPGLLRSLVPPRRLPGMLGAWGSYMPLATALALLIGPAWIATFGWRSGWLALAGLSAGMALAVHRAAGRALAPAFNPVLPAVSGGARPGGRRSAASGAGSWLDGARETARTLGPWLLAAAFALYAAQWLAVIGFLPTVYLTLGLAPGWMGPLTALAAAVNVLGNLAAGRLLQRGWAPPRLLITGFVAMGLGGLLLFAEPGGQGAPGAGRYAAVLLFSAVGGAIPATLFTLGLRLAPGPRSTAATMGWMQQGSALGQFAGPPAVAWVASQVGGWHWSWAVTSSLAAAGVLMAWAISATLRRVDAASLRQAG